MKLKNLLLTVMLSAVFSAAASNAFASGASESFSTTAAIKQQRSTVTTYHRTRAAAVASVAAANRRGYSAKMSYNSFLRKWVVKINYLGSTSSNSNTRNSTTSGGEIGVGCETVLGNAEILYFPSRSMADGIYRAHLRQGDCAKIWNAGSKGWAVAVKAITGRGLRPNRPSKAISSINNKPLQDGVARSGGINSIRTRIAKSGGINSIRAGVTRPSRNGATKPSFV